MRLRWVTSAMASAGLVAICLAGCSRQPSRPPGVAEEDVTVVPVGVEPAQVGSLRATIHASGTIVPADGAEFLAIAPEPARIIEITRDVGDPVSAGDVLVRFDLPAATQEVARQRAEVARAEAQLENTRATRARMADFVERGLVARNELNQAERELMNAQATVAAAAAALERAQDQAAQATIRAPFSGVVANRLHNPGDLAQASSTDPVLRVVDPTRLELLAAIEGADVARVLPGASARVAGAIDGRAVSLQVSARPTGTPDQQGRLYARLTFLSASPLPVDSAVEVDIDAEERSGVVFVSPTALVASGPNAALFVAAGDVARRRAVTTGVTTDLGVEITSGLEAGELVITRGQASVKDGDPISAGR